MTVVRLTLVVTVSFTLWLAAAAGADQAPLQAPPMGDRWFSISLNGERTGFAHQKIVPAPGGGYDVQGEGSVKIRVFGFSREATFREQYRINRDLSLKTFFVKQVIDGSPLSVSGETTPRGIRLTIETSGTKKEKTVKAKGLVYPAPVLNLYPLTRKAPPGATLSLQTLDVEALKVKTVKMSIVGPETLPDGVKTLHLRNNLYSLVDNDIWVDLAGNTVRESVRDGLVVTQAEDPATAARFLLDAAVAKKDLILDFSLVKVVPPLVHPEKLKKLVVEFAGVPTNLPLLESPAQKATRLPAERVIFSLERMGAPSGKGDGEDLRRYLEATPRLPVDHPEIVARKDVILAGVQGPAEMAGKLAGWVAATIKGAVTDSQSPLETLESRVGNCQAHARLFTTLARAAGIPTRFVSGLVYMEGKGFLYHSWAECFVGGGWEPIDPTFGQVPADVTHIKLVEGESPEEMLPLAGVVGRITAHVVETRE